jgi:hypothetical protein
MNIFYLSHTPSRCARWHCDKHVVKMILETCQLLYTAHWVLAAAAAAGAVPDFSTAPRRGDGERGYKSIRNKNHPCAIWVRESREHYFWLCQLGLALCDEFRHRFGNKTHACYTHLLWLTENAPAGLKGRGWRAPAQAMPPEYQRPKNSIVAYRVYYQESKGARGLLQYTARHRPHWLRKA